MKKSIIQSSEILELMRIKGWTRTRLAAELDLTENAVVRWLNYTDGVGGPAAVLMRIWLNAAKEERKEEGEERGKRKRAVASRRS